jgi:hypothetical protein
MPPHDINLERAEACGYPVTSQNVIPGYESMQRWYCDHMSYFAENDAWRGLLRPGIVTWARNHRKTNL